MDFFAKAHPAHKHPQQRKAEDTTKKQLRQMLYGYRCNDPRAIKRSAEPKIELMVGDSLSYNGFSDSELMHNMNIEGLSSEDSSDGQQCLVVNKNNRRNVSETCSNDEDPQSDNMGTDNSSLSVADSSSISEFNDDMVSLSGESESEQFDFAGQGHNKPISSNIITEDSVDSNQFDTDGGLAGKILSRLEKRQKLRSFMPRKKIKLSHIKNLMNNWSIEDVEYKPLPNTDVIDTSCQTSPDDFPNVPKARVEASTNTSKEEAEEFKQQIRPVSPPEPYVLYQAKDFEHQPLSEVMRGYNFSTVARQSQDIVIVSEPVDNLFPAELQNHEALNSESSEDEIEEDDFVPSPAPAEPDQENREIEHQDELIVEPNILDEDDDEIHNDYEEHAETQSDVVQSEEIDSREPVSLYYAKTSCVVVMKHPAKLFIHGKLIVHLLGGAANIHGYSLKDGPCEIYAPNYNYAQYLETVENPKDYYGLFGKLTTIGLKVSEAEDIVTSLGENDAVLHLNSLKSNKLEFVENNFTLADLFSKPSKHISEILKQASEMLGCSLYLEKPTRCFIEKDDWANVVKFCDEPNSRGIVCGGKSTGKSTFLRYYVNRCLAKGPVLVIDLDPGQSEFTVAGNISATVVTEPLLGPNFTHLKTPNLMLNIGMINVMDNLKRYKNAITDLIAHCNTDKQYEKMPWIINTMGMCNKVGLKLTTLVILLAKPMFIMQLDSKNVKKRYECYLNAHAVKNHYDIFKAKGDFFFTNVYASPDDFDFSLYLSQEESDSDGKRTNYSLAPRDERYLNFLAYFGGGVENRKSSSLLAVNPYEVELQTLKIASNVKFNEEAAYKVLNGKVVALCQQAPEDRTDRIFTLQDKPLLCLGHALIRGVDMELGLLYVVTPERAERICLVKAMLYADWVPELRLEVSLPDHITVPYRTSTLQHQRQLMFTAKRRFNPIQYLKAARNT